MTILAWVIISFIAGISASAIIATVIVGRKNGDPLATAWIKIRPIITEVFAEAVKIYQADKLGYDALVGYCVRYAKRKVDDASFLSTEEKALLSYEFIYGILEPQLRKLWEKKMLSQISE